MSSQIADPALPTDVVHDPAVAGLSSPGPIDAAARAERRARFLQLVADSISVHLADNVDYLVEPWGRELPPPTAVGARLSEQLEIVERADALWVALGDEPSRDLMLRFFAYRALGPAHVRMQLDPLEYRRTVIAMAHTLRQAMVVSIPGMPMEWQLHHYDFSQHGMPLQIVGSPLPLASTLALSQYAYRDVAVPARPQAGDVALDVGGCWGETALWLAHGVGESGFVHSFEPSPANRQVLDHNLGLNPVLASRVAVWDEPLAARPGETVWLPNALSPGAALQAEPGESGALIELQTESVDSLVDGGRILRVDFMKLDVEGAELSILEGAAETICRHRPRLAIACYHRPDDLVSIPGFLHGLGVGYRWYLQCATMTDLDTVLFGVPA